jgi:hypothetical protein
VRVWEIRAAGIPTSEAIEASLKLIAPDAMPNAKTDAAKPEPMSRPL